MKENNYVTRSVVYRRPDGRMIVSAGFPGDFCMI